MQATLATRILRCGAALLLFVSGVAQAGAQSCCSGVDEVLTSSSIVRSGTRYEQLLNIPMQASTAEGDLILDKIELQCTHEVSANADPVRRQYGFELVYDVTSTASLRLRDRFPGIRFTPGIGHVRWTSTCAGDPHDLECSSATASLGRFLVTALFSGPRQLFYDKSRGIKQNSPPTEMWVATTANGYNRTTYFRNVEIENLNGNPETWVFTDAIRPSMNAYTIPALYSEIHTERRVPFMSTRVIEMTVKLTDERHKKPFVLNFIPLTR